MRMIKKAKNHIEDAKQALISLGLPRAQQNERSALCLLALLNLTPGKLCPVDGKRHAELARLFATAKAGLV